MYLSDAQIDVLPSTYCTYWSTVVTSVKLNVMIVVAQITPDTVGSTIMIVCKLMFT